MFSLTPVEDDIRWLCPRCKALLGVFSFVVMTSRDKFFSFHCVRQLIFKESTSKTQWGDKGQIYNWKWFINSVFRNETWYGGTLPCPHCCFCIMKGLLLNAFLFQVGYCYSSEESLLTHVSKCYRIQLAKQFLGFDVHCWDRQFSLFQIECSVERSVTIFDTKKLAGCPKAARTSYFQFSADEQYFCILAHFFKQVLW